LTTQPATKEDKSNKLDNMQIHRVDQQVGMDDMEMDSAPEALSVPVSSSKNGDGKKERDDRAIARSKEKLSPPKVGDRKDPKKLRDGSNNPQDRREKETRRQKEARDRRVLERRKRRKQAESFAKALPKIKEEDFGKNADVELLNKAFASVEGYALPVWRSADKKSLRSWQFLGF